MGTSSAARATISTIMPEASAAELGLAVVEAWHLPVVAFDRGGTVSLANAAARELWGLVDGPGSDGRPVRWFDDALPGAAIAPADGSPQEQWRVLAPADGPARPALVQTRALHDARGVVIGSVMTILAVESTVEQQLQSYASDLEMLAEVSRLLAEVSDPDEAAAMICTVAVGATGASALLLWSLADGTLEVAHQESCLASDDFDLVAATAEAGALRALTSSERMIDHLGAGGEPDGDDGPANPDATSFTVWHEPLISGGQPTGVLTIVWSGVLSDLDRPAALISSLAQHSATTLERSELLRRLAQAARTDALTGLANRRVWDERLEYEMKRAGRDEHPLGLILIDIDHFKRYNDTRGHPEGDLLLGDAAQAWSVRLRATDLLARVGGEEFAVLLPACSQADAVTVADTLRTAVPFGQTCSLGVVTSAAGVTATELYGAADAALYRAKHGGRNRIEVGCVEPPG
jgi:diguanylate cyclase (GGDEF)-like protein